jgi:hypothetical protein
MWIIGRGRRGSCDDHSLNASPGQDVPHRLPDSRRHPSMGGDSLAYRRALWLASVDAFDRLVLG